MSWYKISHGLPQDSKLALAARRAGVTRGEALAVWIYLMDKASRARPRGFAVEVDADEVAAALELEPARAAALLQALRDRKMIAVSGALAGWAREQRLSTPRTRAHRARKKLDDAAGACRDSDASRRARLQGDMQARYRQQGRHLAAADTTLTPRR